MHFDGVCKTVLLLQSVIEWFVLNWYNRTVTIPAIEAALMSYATEIGPLYFALGSLTFV